MSVIFKQYDLQSLSHASCLLGDTKSQVAVIVDSQRDIEQYLTNLNHHHLILQYISLTHFHADFVAGHIKLHRQTRADIDLGTQAKTNYIFHPMRHGDEIALRSRQLTILETPGHTPEGISIMGYDLKEDGNNPRGRETITSQNSRLDLRQVGSI